MHFKCSIKKQRLAQNVLTVRYGANNITATYFLSDLLFSTHDKFLQALSCCVICRDCHDVLMVKLGTDLCLGKMS